MSDLAGGVQQYHILNLGGGRQSTALYVMFCRGQLSPMIDCAIFADTQDEPSWVYENLKWLKALNGPPILIRSKGCLGDDLVNGVNSTGKRVASIPAFTTANHGADTGQVRRQCTMEYKLEVIDRVIRREIAGLAPKRSLPKGLEIHQYIGFAYEEIGRMRKMLARPLRRRWFYHFPLIDLCASTEDCGRYLKPITPHEVKRSACVFCPFKEDAEWQYLKDNEPEGWARAVQVDHALRDPGSIVNRQVDQVMYLHRSCKPLELVQLKSKDNKQTRMSFASECLGMCGM